MSKNYKKTMDKMTFRNDFKTVYENYDFENSRYETHIVCHTNTGRKVHLRVEHKIDGTRERVKMRIDKECMILTNDNPVAFVSNKDFFSKLDLDDTMSHIDELSKKILYRIMAYGHRYGKEPTWYCPRIQPLLSFKHLIG